MVQVDCWRHIRRVIKAIGVQIAVSPDMYCHWLKEKKSYSLLKNLLPVKYTRSIPQILEMFYNMCQKEVSFSLWRSLQCFMFPSFLSPPLSVIHMSCVYGPEGKTHVNTMSAWKLLWFILSEDSIYWMWCKSTAVYYLEILQKRS